MRLTKTGRDEYQRLWSTCRIRPKRRATVDALVDRLAASRGRYEGATSGTGVPWYVVGAIHLLESGADFARHLHNGDPLTARTVHVPAGRPATGSPPFTWEESAADAIRHQGLHRWNDWSLPGTLYVLERYNGFGYRPRGIPSPYLWSFSTHYSKGKFVADGRYSPTAVSQQCGAAVLLLRLVERGFVSLDGRSRDGDVPAADGILRRGDRGAAVKKLKTRLRKWFDAASPGEWASLGIADDTNFGARLERAVKTFQARAGLDPDGEVGPLTLAALAAKPTRPTPPQVDDLVFRGVLKRSATGERVRLVQGWLSLNGVNVAIDGDYGPATEEGVRRFQATRGLPETGEVDRATHDALVAPMTAALAPIAKRRALGELVVAYARQHLRQHPREVGGANSGPWVRLYTDGREGTPFPWCAGFATWCLKQACETLGVAQPVQRTLACDVMADSAGARFVPGEQAKGRIRPGSFFLQRARGAERNLYRYRHTGIVVSAGPETMVTIEGNTNDEGSNEGYEVCERIRGYGNMDFVIL